MNFKAGNFYGNDLTIEVIKRTEKTITFKTVAWGVKRCKIKDYGNGVEVIYFKAWIITANENFNAEESKKIALEKAYM